MEHPAAGLDYGEDVWLAVLVLGGALSSRFLRRLVCGPVLVVVMIEDKFPRIIILGP